MTDTTAFTGTISSADMSSGLGYKTAAESALNDAWTAVNLMATGTVKTNLQSYLNTACLNLGSMGTLFDTATSRASLTFGPQSQPSGGVKHT